MPRTGVAKALEGVDMKPHFKYLIRYIRETEEKVYMPSDCHPSIS